MTLTSARDNQVDSHRGTRVVSGAHEVLSAGSRVIDSVSARLCVYADQNAPPVNFQIDPYSDLYRSLHKRGIRVEFITEITADNVAYCKRMISEFGIDLRHSTDSIRGYFLVADGKVFLASPVIMKDRPVDQMVYSDSTELAQQYQLLFDSQWSKCLPGAQVIESIEAGRPVELTRFIYDQTSAVQKVIAILSKAKIEVNGIGNENAPNLIMSFEAYRNTVRDVGKRIKRGRYITNITSANLPACKTLAYEFGIELRHLAGIQTNVAFSESEFSLDLSQPHPGAPSTKVLYSNVPELLSQQKQLFETLWSIGQEGTQRIREIEEGIEPEQTKLLADYAEVTALSQDVAQTVQREAMIIIPTPKRLITTPQVFGVFAKKAAEKVRVRVLTPVDPNSTDDIIKGFPMLRIRNISPVGIGLIIADRSRMVIVQYADYESSDLSKAITGGIFSTHKATIESVASIFESLWKETQLRADEAKIRRQSELLQDILTHDIRNYNQVAKMSAELIREESAHNPQIESLAATLLTAIDGSTELVERAKKLGRIITQKRVHLSSVDFVKTAENSLQLVKTAFSGRTVDCKIESPKEPVLVAADDLLAEACDNLFSNSVKYSDGPAKIEINISRKEAGTKGRPEQYWKIEISDYGKGMREETKLSAFTRYLSTAKGSGLGLSIVYAIIIERYGGKLKIRNRVENDYSQGTTIEIWLKRALP